MRQFMKISGILFLFTVIAIAGTPGVKSHPRSSLMLNNTRFALLHSGSEDPLAQQTVHLKDTIQPKSGVKAAFLSAFIPGAGEVYAKSYWKAAVFAALEIGLWTANAVYNKKGDREDSKMRNYAEAHWSDQVYWSYVYKKAVDAGLWNGPTFNGSTDAQGRFIITDPNFDQSALRKLYGLQDDLGFTHQLPLSRTQQYYEMIYKYLGQFGIGWDDVVQTFNDPYYYEVDSHLGHLTPNIAKYRSMRNLSNHYYDVATAMLNFVLVNHLLSAFDAAWTVKKYNLHIQQAVRVKPYDRTMEPAVVYGLNIRW